MNARVVLIFIAMTAVWISMVMRAAQLQILPSSRLAALQRRQYNTLIKLPARRGLITDRKGKELAVTIPAYSIFADPKEIENPKKFSRVIGKKLGMSSKYIYKKIKNREKRFVWLSRRLKKEFVESVQAMKFKGLGVIEETERVYPNEKLLSQVIGFVGREGQGLEGLELKYNDKLQGEDRKIKIERDARGRPLLVDGRIFTDVPAGFDLTLTIDHELQYRLERELALAVEEQDADGAVGVILDAQTSEILAMGNVPTFDPNRPQSFDILSKKNRVITDAFEPGSTMKTIVVAGALREGTLKPNKKYFCENGKFKVGKHYIHEADQHHTFGWITATEVLAHSSNIGMAKIGFELGDKKVQKILSDFGIGSRLGIDLPGESSGILHATPWREHLLANIAFGHGMTATPLQVAAAYAAIANGGVLKSPFIVKKTYNQETGEQFEFEAQEIRRVLSAEQSATMRLMLNAATSSTGTGATAQVPGFPIAGKTGTAQKNVEGRGYVKGQYISSFAGFIPANDPKYVIYVAVDNPKNKYYGSEVAAPLFAKVAGYAVRRGGLSPVLISEKNVVKKPAEKTQAKVREESISKIREMAKMLTDDEQNRTPDFTGLTLREVFSRVRGTPLKVDIHGEGVVSLSYPSPGHDLPEDKTIKLYFKNE
ncbi:MAG: PASTA domain-containing protein [Bdellovibrionales bacterium]|nr:PASTA domain-containing protein [Bdellovibrionales bacterium]